MRNKDNDQYEDFGRSVDSLPNYDSRKRNSENFPKQISENFSLGKPENISKSNSENFSCIPGERKPENFSKGKTENFRDEKLKIFEGGMSKRKTENFSDFDQLEKVTKNNIWPPRKVKPENLFVEYCIYRLRRVMRNKSKEPTPEKIREFFDEVVEIKHIAENSSTKEEIFNLIEHYNDGDYPNAFSRRVNMETLTVDEMKRVGFSEKGMQAKKGVNRRTRILPINRNKKSQRIGKDYVRNKKIISTDLQNTFGFYAGLYPPESVRFNLRKKLYPIFYNSFCDLAETLNISALDISHRGNIAYTFGLRGGGRGNSSYEMDKKTINLSKFHGNGRFATEWFKSLNHYLANINNLHGVYYTDVGGDIESLNKLVEMLKFDTPEYLEESKRIDKYEKRKNRRWSTIVDMSARAFNSYLIDKMKERNLVNEYLALEYDDVEVDGETYTLYPRKSERKRLNGVFDELFDELREKHIVLPFNRNEV